MTMLRTLAFGAVIAATATAQSSITTTFADNNGRSTSGAMTMFDITANVPITITAFDINSTTAAGGMGTIDVYLTALGGTYVGNQLNAALVGRVEIHRRLILGLTGSLGTVLALVAFDLSGTAGLVSVTSALFVMMIFTGLVTPNATTLALDGQPPRVAGSGSALLGTLQFGLGSGLASTAELSGQVTLTDMNTVMLLTALGAAAVFTFFAVHTRRQLRA